MNNFGLYVQDARSYRDDATYTVQAEPVNYSELYQWYYESIEGDKKVCSVKQYHNNNYHVVESGFAYIVAGDFEDVANPDARLSFSDGQVIVATRKAKITTNPQSSPNEIVVEALDTNPAYNWKMVIKNPKAWYCCTDTEPLASGDYKHRQQDHQIELSQGDTVAIAGADTIVELYAVEGGSGLKKTDSYRTFLHAYDEAAGDSGVNLGGDAEDKTDNSHLLENMNAKPDIDTSNIYGRSGVWHRGAPPNDGKWWYGVDGATDYAKDQYVLEEDDGQGRIYLFDSEGWAYTGWAPDGYYYTTEAEADGERLKECELAYNTLVPSETDPNLFIYLDDNGNKADPEELKSNAEMNGVSYSWDENSGGYRRTDGTFAQVSQPTYGENQQGSGHNPLGGTNHITDDEIDTLTTNKSDGWYKDEEGEDWYYVESGQLSRGSDWSEDNLFYKEIGGVLYWFYEDYSLYVADGWKRVPGTYNGRVYWCYNDMGTSNLTGWQLVDSEDDGWIYLERPVEGGSPYAVTEKLIDGYWLDEDGYGTLYVD